MRMECETSDTCRQYHRTQHPRSQYRYQVRSSNRGQRGRRGAYSVQIGMVTCSRKSSRKSWASGKTIKFLHKIDSSAPLAQPGKSLLIVGDSCSCGGVGLVNMYWHQCNEMGKRTPLSLTSSYQVSHLEAEEKRSP